MPRPRCLTMLALLAPAALPAQGGTAAVFLGQPASARAAALGDAYAAAGAEDVAALFYNPAALAAVRGVAAAGSVERYVASSTLAALAVAGRVGRVAMGAGVRALDYPDVAEVVETGDGDGIATGRTLSASDLAAGVAAAVGGRHGRVGIAASWVAQSLPGATGGTLAADVGAAREVVARPWGTVTVGAAWQHLGGDVEVGAGRAALPRTWRAGAALSGVALAGARWTAAVDAVGERGLAVAPRAGLEGTWRARGAALAARAGWSTQEAGALARPLALGAGVRVHGLWVDYAWRQWAVLGSTHRVGARWERR